MSSGKRWTVEITWRDNDSYEATTTYDTDERDDVVNVVARSVAKLCKATYGATIVETYVKMFCLTCNYDSEKESVDACSYLCSCDKKGEY